ncbi:uncharacterized protein LOC133739540 [Rosa rugosa]|uniref:uncharacterized protein LOC133739540 n=1 Tax=Rosa rugosa TaxID=74645 RepID=UPI002B40A610|nr:uncharacterized protein LOC133739540 [Rosa rugosa]XP_062023308.1 uncharacterized protein LOC133739540 [Rosa rugosa]
MTLSSLSRQTLRSKPALSGGGGGTTKFLTLGREVSQPRCGSASWIWKGGDVSLSSPFLGDGSAWLRRPLNLCLDPFCLLDGSDMLQAAILAEMARVSLHSTSSAVGRAGLFAAVFGLGDVGQGIGDDWIVQAGLDSDPITWEAEDDVLGGEPDSLLAAMIAAGLQLDWDGDDGDLSPMLDGGEGKGCGGSGGGGPAEGGGCLVARNARVCFWALRLLGLEWTSAHGWSLWAYFWTVDFLCAVWVSCWAMFDWGFSSWAALMNEDGVDDDTSSSTPNFI